MLSIFQIEAVCTGVSSAKTKTGKSMLYLTFDNHLTIPVFGDSAASVKELNLQDKLCTLTAAARENAEGFINYSLVHVGVKM